MNEKAIVSELKVWPTLTPGAPSKSTFVLPKRPWAAQEDPGQGGIQPLCSRGESLGTDKENHQDTAQKTQIKKNLGSTKERALGKLLDHIFYPINLLPQFQIPYLHFPLEFQFPYLHLFLLIKKAGLRGNVRLVCKGYIAHHLLSSLTIWIKRPQRFSPCLCLLVLVATGSPNTDLSGFRSVCYSSLYHCTPCSDTSLDSSLVGTTGPYWICFIAH